MKQLPALLVTLLTVVGASLSIAQQVPETPSKAPKDSTEAAPAVPTPAPTIAPQSSTAPPVAQPSPAPNNPIVVNIPNPIKIESTASGNSGGAGSGWLAFLGVFCTAAASLFVGYRAAQNVERGRITTMQVAAQDREARVRLAEQDLAVRKAQFDEQLAEQSRQAAMTRETAKIAEENKTTIEGRRIAHEMERFGLQTGISENEAYLAATRLVHEQQVAEAELIHSFSDRLLSESEKERSFALFVLSAYVSPEVIGRIAAGGKTVISDESLEMLAALDDDEIAKIARRILEHRKTSQTSKENAARGNFPESPLGKR